MKRCAKAGHWRCCACSWSPGARIKRAHLASIGCPVLGDSKYGNTQANRAWHFKYQALCAYSLCFPAMEKESPCAGLSGKTLFAEEPWYAAQIKNGTLG